MMSCYTMNPVNTSSSESADDLELPPYLNLDDIFFDAPLFQPNGCNGNASNQTVQMTPQQQLQMTFAAFQQQQQQQQQQQLHEQQQQLQPSTINFAMNNAIGTHFLPVSMAPNPQVQHIPQQLQQQQQQPQQIPSCVGSFGNNNNNNNTFDLFADLEPKPLSEMLWMMPSGNMGNMPATQFSANLINNVPGVSNLPSTAAVPAKPVAPVSSAPVPSMNRKRRASDMADSGLPPTMEIGVGGRPKFNRRYVAIVRDFFSRNTISFFLAHAHFIPCL